tara:strand:+ start:2829 stop:3443 length:615 start_codon:yes stop_codon:yes gene_type:complete
MTSTVYLKIKEHSGTSASVDTIPLQVTGVSISVDKQIPAFPIPLSGLGTGESSTAALDLGMSTKRISLNGFINETVIQRSHTKTGDTPDSLTFTPQEVAQLIASGVDSTGIANYQAINELVVLIPSKVNESYVQVAERNIPLSFAARGGDNEKDNEGVGSPFPFPTSSTSSGLKGFVQNFGYEMSSESVDISFTLEFVVAFTLP